MNSKFLEKNLLPKVLLLGFIIIGVSILVYGYLNFVYRNNTLAAEQENKKTQLRMDLEAKQIKETQYGNCKQNAENAYTYQWNLACKDLGISSRSDGCTLPVINGNNIEAIRTKALDNCVKLYTAN